jgi:hypothetical protein
VGGNKIIAMCSKEEVEQLIDKKIFGFKEQVFEHTSKILREHTSSPKTIEELTNIKKTCSERGTELALMNQLIQKVCEQQSKQEEKLDKIREENRVDRNEMNEEGKRQHDETMNKLDEMSRTKADKEELIKVELEVKTKAEKDSLTRLEKLTYWVLAISATSLISFLITVIWFLLNKLVN